MSTDEQADSGAGLVAQRSAIETEAARRGWHLVAVEVDAGASGKSLTGRPALTASLAAVTGGQADVLLVAKLDRLSRSLLDFAGLMARSQAEGWSLVALDLGVDTSTPAGEFMASVMASAAQWERRIIGQRTRDALSVKRSKACSSAGHHRSPTTSPRSSNSTAPAASAFALSQIGCPPTWFPPSAADPDGRRLACSGCSNRAAQVASARPTPR